MSDLPVMVRAEVSCSAPRSQAPRGGSVAGLVAEGDRGHCLLYAPPPAQSCTLLIHTTSRLGTNPRTGGVPSRSSAEAASTARCALLRSARMLHGLAGCGPARSARHTCHHGNAAAGAVERHCGRTSPGRPASRAACTARRAPSSPPTRSLHPTCGRVCEQHTDRLGHAPLSFEVRPCAIGKGPAAALSAGRTDPPSPPTINPIAGFLDPE